MADLSDIQAAQSVKIIGSNSNGLENTPINASSNGDLFSRDVINVAGQNRAQSVTTTAAEALGGASRLTNRKFIKLTPTNGTIYWGFTNAVTSTTGSPIFKNQTVTFAFTDNIPIFVISSSTVDCRIAEGS